MGKCDGPWLGPYTGAAHGPKIKDCAASLKFLKKMLNGGGRATTFYHFLPRSITLYHVLFKTIVCYPVFTR
jgi:hypothetical protein